MVAGERAAAILTELHARLESCFARPEPYAQARKYVEGLMSDLPRKNGWTVAEHAGDATPDRTQRLLNHAVWDTERAAGVVRGFVVEHLAGGAELTVGALDESGHQKQGSATAGSKRQYMGAPAGSRTGSTPCTAPMPRPVGTRWSAPGSGCPAEQLEDPDRRAALGIPDAVEFATKPQLAQQIVADMVADQTMPPWFAGDEVYGRSPHLRDYLEQQGAGYVLRAGCDFRVEMTAGTRERLDHLAAKHLTGPNHRNRWETRSVPGSKGARAYAWAWLGTADNNHHVLIRKHLGSGELAYHYYVPPGRPVTLTTLVRVACLRWRVEETFEFGNWRGCASSPPTPRATLRACAP